MTRGLSGSIRLTSIGSLRALRSGRAWAVLLWLTGGFRVELAGLRISSRRPSQCCCDLAALRDAGVAVVVLARWAQYLPKRMGALAAWSAATSVWRCAHGTHLASRQPFPIAAAAIAIDIYQWSAALPLWVDEEAIALNVRDRSIGDLAGSLWLGQSAPFGWLVLERSAMATLGTGEAALRAVPLLFGIATVGVAVWVGRRWMGRIGALRVRPVVLDRPMARRTIDSRSNTTLRIFFSVCFFRRSQSGR